MHIHDFQFWELHKLSVLVNGRKKERMRWGESKGGKERERGEIIDYLGRFSARSSS